MIGLEKNRKLWATARRYFSPERIYSEAHLKTKLEQYLKITPDQAEQELRLMIERGVLISLPFDSNTYYLSDSTPF